MSVESDGPGSAGERGDEFTQGQVGALDKSGLHFAGQ